MGDGCLKSIRILAIAAGLCFGAAGALAADASRFAAVESDASFKALFERWARIEGRRLVWQADGDAAIFDPESLNDAARLRGAGSFEQALERLDRLLEKENEANPRKPEQFQACVYTDAIVVRTVGQGPRQAGAGGMPRGEGQGVDRKVEAKER